MLNQQQISVFCGGGIICCSTILLWEMTRSHYSSVAESMLKEQLELSNLTEVLILVLENNCCDVRHSLGGITVAASDQSYFSSGTIGMLIYNYNYKIKHQGIRNGLLQKKHLQWQSGQMAEFSPFSSFVCRFSILIISSDMTSLSASSEIFLGVIDWLWVRL